MGKRARHVSSSSASSCSSQGSPPASSSEDEASLTSKRSGFNKGAKSKLHRKIMKGLKQAAKAESTMSFRKTSNPSSSQKRQREQHSKARKASSTSQKKDKPLSFGRVALSTLEVIQDDELSHAIFADGEESQLVVSSDFVRWENMGLAITDFQNGIEINPAWTYSETLEAIYTLFPRAAKYIKASLRIRNPEYQHGVDEDFKEFFCPFVLCMKEERRYVILPSIKANWPTGRDIANNCVSKNKNGWAENTLLLCSRVPFPLDILRQWRRGKSPIPDPPALASDDEELEAGLTSLFQNKSVTSNEKAKTVESANDTTYEGKGKFKAQEGSSFLPDEQPPAKRRRKTLFLSDSEDEGAEEDEDSVGNCEDNYFPGLQTAIANSRSERRTTRSMAGSSSSATNATLLPDLGGPSATDTSGSVSASTSHTPDVLLPDAEVEESERPLWLTDSLHYMRRYNFTSSTFSSDRPKFKF